MNLKQRIIDLLARARNGIAYAANVGTQLGAYALAKAGIREQITLENYWTVECHGPDGVLKWRDAFANLVTTAGKNDILTQYLKGSAYTAAWYVGLTSTSPTVAAADTMASHSGWTEVVAYSEANRQTLTLGTASAGSIDNTASKATFTINANSTGVGGAFVVTNNTKSGTTGTLYGVGAFTGGDKTLSSGDVLSVSVTLTAS
jgi:hypothetical protein